MDIILGFLIKLSGSLWKGTISIFNEGDGCKFMKFMIEVYAVINCLTISYQLVLVTEEVYGNALKCFHTTDYVI